MPDDVYPIIGKAIRLRREEIGMTQAVLAELAGLSRTSITNIERGGQALFVHQFLELARALRVDISALVPNAVMSVGQRRRASPTKNDREVAGELKSLLERLETPRAKGRPR